MVDQFTKKMSSLWDWSNLNILADVLKVYCSYVTEYSNLLELPIINFLQNCLFSRALLATIIKYYSLCETNT